MSGAKPHVAHEAADGQSVGASWRDSVPEASAADLENLMGTGLGAAQEQLQRNGGFLPFALVVENDGEVRLMAVTPADAAEGSDGDFDADAMINDLTELLRQNRADFAAVLPYAANTASREWEFGQLAADTNEPAIWVD